MHILVLFLIVYLKKLQTYIFLLFVFAFPWSGDTTCYVYVCTATVSFHFVSPDLVIHSTPQLPPSWLETWSTTLIHFSLTSKVDSVVQQDSNEGRSFWQWFILCQSFVVDLLCNISLNQVIEVISCPLRLSGIIGGIIQATTWTYLQTMTFYLLSCSHTYFIFYYLYYFLFLVVRVYRFIGKRLKNWPNSFRR